MHLAGLIDKPAQIPLEFAALLQAMLLAHRRGGEIGRRASFRY